MRVLAVDPGLTTGLASYDSDTDEFAAWAVEGQLKVIDQIQLTIETVDVMVLERFTISARTIKLSRGGSNAAIEIIGALRWMAHAYSRPDEDAELRRNIRVVEQAPSAAMQFVTDEKLKRLGWYTPGKDHARDATRHLVLFLAEQGVLAPERLLPLTSTAGKGGTSASS